MAAAVDSYAGARVLITGGLGFIGSTLAIALAEREAQVTIVDAMLPAYGARLYNVEPVRERLRINLSDLRDRASLKHLVRDQDVIFNLAGQSSHLRSMEDPRTDLEINCHSQVSLLECVRAENPDVRIVLASTRQVYGRPLRCPVDESHPTVPVDVNGIHKLAAEQYYRLYGDVHGLRAVVLRLTNTYGPRMDLSNADKGVVGVFLRRALEGGTLRLFGDGAQRRDFNYVDDVVDALLLAGRKDSVVGGMFNLGHSRSYSLAELAEMLRRLTGCRCEQVPFPEDQRAIDIGDYWADYGRFRKATGWEPVVDLEEGVRRTLAFFREHAAEYLSAPTR